MKSLVKPLILSMLLSLVLSAVQATESRGREGGSGGASAGQSTQLQLQIRKLMSDNQQLQTQVTELTTSLEAADKKAKGLEKDLNKSTLTAEKFKESTGLMHAKLDETVVKYKELIEKYKAKLLDTANKLQQTSLEKSKLDTSLREETATKLHCETSNQRLVQYNQEILAHYEDKGMMDSMLQNDKVAGLKSVEIENILQEYRDKIEDEHVQVEATISNK